MWNKHQVERAKLSTQLGVPLVASFGHPSLLNIVGFQVVGFLRRNLQIHQKHIKSNAYKALVRPQIEYASTVWDPFTQENQNKIEMVQRRAARFVCNNYSREASVTVMLDELGWRSLKQRRTDQRLIMLYKIVNNLIEVDIANELKPHSRHSRNVL